MKLKSVLFIVLAAFFLFSGCNSINSSKDSGKTSYEKVQEKLVNLESFKSEATVEYKSNKGSNVYDTIQQCKMDGKYRIEVTGPENVSGNITLSNGEVICQFNSKVSGKISVGVKENLERSEIFLTSFVKNYLTSQEVSISVGSFGSENYTVLEAIIPGNHPYLSTEKLWVDNKTLNPVKLILFDQDGSERIVVNYKTFEYNVTLEDTLFTM